MPHVSVLCTCKTCGEEYYEERYFSGKGCAKRAREWREWADGQFDECPICHKARIEKEHRLANEAAAKAAKEAGLPALIGSVKQIAWAETIRQQKLAEMDKAMNRIKQHYSEDSLNNLENAEYLRKKMSVYSFIIADIINENSASWWIDNRCFDGSKLILHRYIGIKSRLDEFIESHSERNE